MPATSTPVISTTTRTFSHEDSDGSNIVEGLVLFEDVVSEEFQQRLVAFVHEQIELGKAGLLIGKTYNPPEQKVWAKLSKSRLLLQYGVFTLCNRVQAHVPVQTLASAPPLVELIDVLVQMGIFKEEERPNSCTVNVYEKGNWVPGHVDNRMFSRPFGSLSLCSVQEIVFGGNIARGDDGLFADPDLFRLRMPVGSFLRLESTVADLTQHALPATDDFRISLTLRRLPTLSEKQE